MQESAPLIVLFLFYGVAGGGLLSRDFGQHDDGGRTSGPFPRTWQGQSVLERHSGRPHTLQPQARPCAGGKR